MKTIVLMAVLLMTSSCGFFKTDKLKNKAVDKIVETVKPMSIKHLGCTTGDAVAKDVGSKLESLFKVKTPRFGNKSLVYDLCKGSLKLVLPYLIDLGSGKLPDSWKEDGCTLEKAGNYLDDLAGGLCGKLGAIKVATLTTNRVASVNEVNFE